jgi:hypothetical protein
MIAKIEIMIARGITLPGLRSSPPMYATVLYPR